MHAYVLPERAQVLHDTQRKRIAFAGRLPQHFLSLPIAIGPKQIERDALARQNADARGQRVAEPGIARARASVKAGVARLGSQLAA